MVKVYFESKVHAEIVALFDNEETYMACLPALEKLAKENRMIVTESIEELDKPSFDEVVDFACKDKEDDKKDI